ncbi:hypothetical protein EO244_16600 [Ancylomarina salipaludis]|uniref:Lipoprotein n=1 Tax=Ancylomarina salipaludis TaxID=2501299 RepID=A0A4Q1JHN9_9BACT|nr:hypothetical protein [Ancylomarina salipaludis]RXQ87260.1 hypothetical protein EO244_16600 [Ancylomarina salipaludis]
MRILLCFSISLLIFGCNNPKLKYSSCYESLGRHFDYSLYNHFPDTLSNFKFYFKKNSPELTKENRSCGALLVVQITNEDLVKIEENIKDSVIATYKPNERCNLIVNLWESEKASEIFLDHYSKQCEDNFIPIPNFMNLLKGTRLIYSSEDGFLSNNFDVNILGAEPGMFIDNNYLSNGVGLPENWRNGYSKGIAINKKANVVIYWLEIW